MNTVLSMFYPAKTMYLYDHLDSVNIPNENIRGMYNNTVAKLSQHQIALYNGLLNDIDDMNDRYGVIKGIDVNNFDASINNIFTPEQINDVNEQINQRDSSRWFGNIDLMQEFNLTSYKELTILSASLYGFMNKLYSDELSETDKEYIKNRLIMY